MQKRIEQETSLDQPGLVVSYFGNSVAVEAEDGQVFQCHLRRNQDLPVVGDRVTWQLKTGNTGIILNIAPRLSVLARGGGSSNKMKPIAANIDAIVIVMAPPPIFSEYLIDRYLVAAELLNIQAILVLNKIDLLNEMTNASAYARMQAYHTIYPIVFTSIFAANGLQDLNTTLKTKASVLVGPSGVGKSSIIAALSESDVIRVGDVSAKGAGKHTTTASCLYHLPQGGSVIDSPGVREFNLWSVSKKEILKGFKEFHPFIGQCQFRDCQHLVEPCCGVQVAVQEGKISSQRFLNYQTLMKKSE